MLEFNVFILLLLVVFARESGIFQILQVFFRSILPI
jgi:hypothetical protein